MINKSNTYVSPLLTNISLGYRNDNYIADELMPVISVQKDTAQIATYGMDNLRVVEAIRSQGSKANEINHTVSIWDHYILEDHALKEFVSDEEVDNADKPIQPQMDATENLTDRILIIREKALSDVISSTAVITQNVTLTGTDKWSDYDNSDPFDDIKTGLETVRTASGKKPNTFTMGYATMMTLMNHPDLIARITTTADKVVTPELVIAALQRAFPWIKKINVWDAQYNSGVEGGTDALADIWADNFWISYTETKPRLKSRAFGFTYAKKGKNKQIKVLPYDADREGRFVRISDKYDQKIVDVTCMYLIKDTV